MGASTYSREAGSIIDPPCLRQAANQQSDYLVMLTDSYFEPPSYVFSLRL